MIDIRFQHKKGQMDTFINFGGGGRRALEVKKFTVNGRKQQHYGN